MDNFNFDVYFRITSFEMATIIGGDIQSRKSNSNRITSDMVKILRRSARGQKIYFENIRATGPDGSKRIISPIMFKIL